MFYEVEGLRGGRFFGLVRGERANGKFRGMRVFCCVESRCYCLLVGLDYAVVFLYEKWIERIILEVNHFLWCYIIRMKNHINYID